MYICCGRVFEINCFLFFCITFQHKCTSHDALLALGIVAKWHIYLILTELIECFLSALLAFSGLARWHSKWPRRSSVSRRSSTPRTWPRATRPTASPSSPTSLSSTTSSRARSKRLVDEHCTPQFDVSSLSTYCYSNSMPLFSQGSPADLNMAAVDIPVKRHNSTDSAGMPLSRYACHVIEWFLQLITAWVK